MAQHDKPTPKPTTKPDPERSSPPAQDTPGPNDRPPGTPTGPNQARLEELERDRVAREAHDRNARPARVVPPEPPPPDAAASFTRTPQATGTEDPGGRRLGEPQPGEPSAAEDPNNPINQNADPAVRDVRRLEGVLAAKLNTLLEKDKKGAYKSGAETLVARYLEDHGRWEHVTHRDHTGARVADTHVGCACPICDDARAALKLEG